jgi:hypothetical protein
MAVTPSRPVVTTTASLIYQHPANPNQGGKAVDLLLKNVTLTDDVYLGDSTVTTATGWHWEIGDGAISWSVEPGESVYGIVATSDQTIHVLAGGR